MKKLLGLLLLTTSAMATIAPVDKQNFQNFPLNSNPGFENGKQGYTSSGATIAEVTSGSNLLFGAKSLTMDASAGSQYLQTALYSIPVGLQGKNCLASIAYKGGDANLTMQVLDGSANVLASQALGVTTVSTSLPLNFICPSSGTMRIKLLSGADAAIVALDQFYLGDAANLTNVSQAAGILSTYLGSDQTVSTTSPTTVQFATELYDTLNAYNTSTYLFTVTKPGKYLVHGGLTIQSATASEQYTLAIMKNSVAQGNSSGAPAAGATQVILNGAVTFDAVIGDTISIQVNSTVDTSYTVRGLIHASNFYIEYFPTASELAYRPDVTNWKVDANISGANPSLGTSAVTSYTSITNGSLTLTNNSGLGNIAAQIPCSSTNAPSGTTCSSGTEDVGVSFVLPAAADVRACVSTGHIINNGAGGYVFTAFQIVETPNNAQTILQEGKDRPQSSSSAASVTTTLPLKVCGIFSFSSAGQKTLRLMYEQGVGGTVTSSEISGDASASAGQRDIHWEVYPITQSLPMPVLVGGLTNSSSGTTRSEAASITCQSGPTSTQVGNWISSVTYNGTGDCTVNFVAGIFSATPVCVVSANSGTIDASANIDATTAISSSLVRLQRQVGGGTANDGDMHLHCIGAH